MMPNLINKTIETYNDEDETDPADIEEINFDHSCGNPDCDHVISPHYFREVSSDKACGKYTPLFFYYV